MRNFTIEDFIGSGQYLVREKENKFITDTGFLSTIMYKVGFDNNNLEIGTGGQITNLISMSDGWTRCFYFLNNEDGTTNFNKKVIWQNTEELGSHQGKQRLCDYLNNSELSQEMRFATQEEIVRVVMYQSSN